MGFQTYKNLDPDNVEQLCKQHRWSSKGIISARSSEFGTVPEAFEQAASMLPEGTDQHKKLTQAFKKAAGIYREQILSDVRNETTGKPRAELESINEMLFKLHHSKEKDGTYVAARLLWAAHMIGDWYYKNGGKQGPASGPGYRQFKL